MKSFDEDVSSWYGLDSFDDLEIENLLSSDLAFGAYSPGKCSSSRVTCVDGGTTASERSEASDERPEALSGRKRVRHGRRRNEIVSRPRILKTDIRRNYATMWTNVFNSCDYDYMMQYLSTFYDPEFHMRHFRKGLALMNPSWKCSKFPDFRGIPALAEFWYGQMTKSPDMVCKLINAQLSIRSNGTAVILTDFELHGTKVLTADEVQKEKESIMQQKEKKKSHLVTVDDIMSAHPNLNHVPNSMMFCKPHFPALPPGVFLAGTPIESAADSMSGSDCACSTDNNSHSSNSSGLSGVVDENTASPHVCVLSESEQFDDFVENELPYLLDLSDISDSESLHDKQHHQQQYKQQHQTKSKKQRVASDCEGCSSSNSVSSISSNSFPSGSKHQPQHSHSPDRQSTEWFDTALQAVESGSIVNSSSINNAATVAVASKTQSTVLPRNSDSSVRDKSYADGYQHCVATQPQRSAMPEQLGPSSAETWQVKYIHRVRLFMHIDCNNRVHAMDVIHYN